MTPTPGSLYSPHCWNGLNSPVTRSWHSLNNSLKILDDPTTAPDGSLVPSYFAKEEFSYNANTPGDSAVILQNIALKNRETYTFSVYVKWSDAMVDAIAASPLDYTQTTTVKIRFPAVNGIYHDQVHLGVKWALPDPNSTLNAGDVSGVWVDTDPYQGYQSSPGLFTDQGYSRDKDDWWRVWVTMNFNPLGVQGEQRLATVMIRPGGVEGPGALPSVDQCPAGQGGAGDGDGNGGGEGECNQDTDCPTGWVCADGVCVDPGGGGDGSVYGCTNSTACNYNPDATIDDGSCELGSWETCWGCMDDGEQLWSPHPGQPACNYDLNAVWPPNAATGRCEYAGYGDLINRDCEGNCVNDFNGDGICDEEDVYGCADPYACNYKPAVTVDDGSCWYAPEETGDCGDFVGCMDPTCHSYEPNATIPCEDCCFGCDDTGGGGGNTWIEGCMDEDATNFDPLATKTCPIIFGFNCCEYICEIGGDANVWIDIEGPYIDPVFGGSNFPDHPFTPSLRNIYLESDTPHSDPQAGTYHVDWESEGSNLYGAGQGDYDRWHSLSIAKGQLPWMSREHNVDASALSWMAETIRGGNQFAEFDRTMLTGGFGFLSDPVGNSWSNETWDMDTRINGGFHSKQGGRVTHYWKDGIDINNIFHPCPEIQKMETEYLFNEPARGLPIFMPRTTEYVVGIAQEWDPYGDWTPEYKVVPTITHLYRDPTVNQHSGASTDPPLPEWDSQQLDRKQQWSFYLKPFSHSTLFGQGRRTIWPGGVGTPYERWTENKWGGALIGGTNDEMWMDPDNVFGTGNQQGWTLTNIAGDSEVDSMIRIFRATISNRSAYLQNNDPQGFVSPEHYPTDTDEAVVTNHAQLQLYIIYEKPEQPYLHPRLKAIIPSTHNWDYDAATTLLQNGALSQSELPPNTGKIGTFHDWGYTVERGGWIRVWLSVGPEDTEYELPNNTNGVWQEEHEDVVPGANAGWNYKTSDLGERLYFTTLEALDNVLDASGIHIDGLLPTHPDYRCGFLTDEGFLRCDIARTDGPLPNYVHDDRLVAGDFSMFGALHQSRSSSWGGGPPGDLTEILPSTEGIVNLNSFPPRGEIGAAYVWNPVVNEGNTPASLDDLNPEVKSPIQEYYESYIPRLIYYMLLTSSKFFTEEGDWDSTIASKLNIDNFSVDEKETNVKYIVDHILAQTVARFPDYFYMGSYKFDVSITEDNNLYLGPAHQMRNGEWMTGVEHTSHGVYLKRLANTSYVNEEDVLVYGMSFNYRGRNYPIPPWDEEKFFVNCDVSEDLIDFLAEQLRTFGVPETLSQQFESYILDNTLRLSGDSKIYNNSFLFLTSSLEVPPNYEEIISTFEKDSFDYLSLWSGKSSIFNLDVSSGPFDGSFFRDQPYHADDFFDSLQVVPDFSPAKSDPRVNVQMSDTDEAVGLDTPGIKISYANQDLIHDLSSGLGGYSISAADMRVSSLGGIGGVIDPTFDFEGYGGRNNHRLLPVFNRDQVSRLEDSLIQGTSALYQPNYSVSSGPIPKTKDSFGLSSLTNTSGASAIDVKRNSFRRRNYSNIIPTDSWYRRNGFDMPSFLNASDTAFNVLGYVASSQEYQDISALHTYHDVWGSCQTAESTDIFFGIKTNNCFPCRGTQELVYGLMSYYQSRNLLPEYLQTIASLIEKKKNLEATTAVLRNKPNFDMSGSYMSASAIAKGSLTYGESIVDYTNFAFSDEFHRLYRDYVTKFEKHGLGQYLATEYSDGGPNILSLIYGPTYFNANLSYNGSAVDVTNPSLVASSFDTEYTINFNASAKDIDVELNESPIGTYVASDTTSLYVQGREFRNPYIISAVELVDTSGAYFPIGGENEFSLFKLNKNSSKKYGNQFYNLNTVLKQKSRGGLPRVRFSLKDYDQTKDAENKKGLLVPDHDYMLSVETLFGREKLNQFGGGKVGIWIHTKAEYNHHNELVFWNWSREGKWEHNKVSEVTGPKGVFKVRDTYSHIIDFKEVYSLDNHPEPQNSYDDTAAYLMSILKKEDFNTTKIPFNTLNRDIKVPFEYYEAHNQVHRTDQDYIIEVFSFPSKQLDKYMLLDGISVVDLIENERVNIPYSFSVPDFSPSFTNSKKYSFYDSTGEELPYGTPFIVDTSGVVTNEDIGAITVGIGKPQGVEQGMYTQVSSYQMSGYYNDASSAPQLGFPQGWFMQEDQSTLTPSSIALIGLTHGTHIKKNYLSSIQVDPGELLNIFRYFNSIAEGKASRVATDTSGWNPRQLQNGTSFEFSGGSRESYRTHPFWDGSGIIVETDQYTSIDINN